MIYAFLKKEKGWQVGAQMHLRMCNSKYCSQDKIEYVVCGEGLGCRVSSREETIEIRVWICRIDVYNFAGTSL